MNLEKNISGQFDKRVWEKRYSVFSQRSRFGSTDRKTTANQRPRLRTFGYFRNSTLSLIRCHRLPHSVAPSIRNGPWAVSTARGLSQDRLKRQRRKASHAKEQSNYLRRPKIPVQPCQSVFANHSYVN